MTGDCYRSTGWGACTADRHLSRGCSVRGCARRRAVTGIVTLATGPHNVRDVLCLYSGPRVLRTLSLNAWDVRAGSQSNHAHQEGGYYKSQGAI